MTHEVSYQEALSDALGRLEMRGVQGREQGTEQVALPLDGLVRLLEAAGWAELPLSGDGLEVGR